MCDRYCANPSCGKLLVKGPTEASGVFAARKCCSKPCNAVIIRLRSVEKMSLMEPRYCAAPGCGKQLVPGPSEPPEKFSRRVTCKRPATCAHRAGAISRMATIKAERLPAPFADEIPVRRFAYPVGFRYEDDPRLPRVRRHGEPVVPDLGSARVA